MPRSILFAVPLILLLGACGSREDGTSMSINAGSGTGSFDGKSGEVKIDTPVFQGSFKLPKMNLTAENFDVNGVHLYPGSRIGTLKVDAGGSGDGDGVVSVKFDSPASVATVRDWLKSEFDKAGTSVTIDGDSLRGKTEDKPFRIDLSPNGQRAAGTVTIG